MKNTLFISPQSHLRVWLLCQPACLSPVHSEAKKDKARLHNLLSVLLIFFFFSFRDGADVCNYIVLGINFFSLQNKLCAASQPVPFFPPLPLNGCA